MMEYWMEETMNEQPFNDIAEVFVGIGSHFSSAQ
jgi:hypothetical protein